MINENKDKTPEQEILDVFYRLRVVFRTYNIPIPDVFGYEKTEDFLEAQTALRCYLLDDILDHLRYNKTDYTQVMGIEIKKV